MLGMLIATMAVGVPTGLVIPQLSVTLQLFAPDAIVQDENDGVKEPVICKKVAETVQAPVITPVV